MSNVCPKCEVGVLSSESEKSCLNCGFVAASAPVFVEDKAVWVASDKYSAGYGLDTGPKTHLNRHLYPSVAKGRKLGRRLIANVGHRLNSNSRIIDESKVLYDRVFDHEDFNGRKLVTKTALAAACFYIVCRQFDCVVTLNDVANAAQCSVFLMDKCKQEILDAFELKIKHVDLVKLTEARCEKANLDKAMIASVFEVIKLCQRMWLSDGRKQETIISAAAFVAWQGEEPVTRLKTNFRAFCKLYKFTFSSQANVLVSVIQEVLCELAKQIPWVVEGSIEPSRIALHLKDIVKFQNTLISGATVDMGCGGGLNSDSSDTDVNSGEESCANNQSSPDLPSASTSLYDMNHFEQSDKTVKSGKRSSKHLAGATRTESKRVEQVVYQATHLDNEELGCEDIPDDQLHLFIKTDAEISKGNEISKGIEKM